jgi:hypothetical protein
VPLYRQSILYDCIAIFSAYLSFPLFCGCCARSRTHHLADPGPPVSLLSPTLCTLFSALPVLCLFTSSRRICRPLIVLLPKYFKVRLKSNMRGRVGHTNTKSVQGEAKDGSHNLHVLTTLAQSNFSFLKSPLRPGESQDDLSKSAFGLVTTSSHVR